MNSILCKQCGTELASIGSGKYRHRKKQPDGHKPVLPLMTINLPVDPPSITAATVMPRLVHVINPTEAIKHPQPPIGVAVANLQEVIKRLDPTAKAIGDMYIHSPDLETARVTDNLFKAYCQEVLNR